MTNLEGRVILRRRAVRTAARRRAATSTSWPGWPSGWATASKFRLRLDGGGVRRVPPGDRRRARRLQRHHLRPDRREDGVFWPCPAEDHPGTPRLFAERFAFPDGQARFHAVGTARPPRCRTPSTRSTSPPAATRSTTTPAPRPAGWRRWRRRGPSRGCRFTRGWRRGCGVADGERLLVESRRGGVTFAVEVTPDIRPDTLFAPFHWGGEPREPAHQPGARPDQPDARVQGLRGARARAAGAEEAALVSARKRRLAIIGNGMATCRLLDELERRGGFERYEIDVFGEERGGAYNRILLSKVLAGDEPDAIITKPPAWYADARRPPARRRRGAAPRHRPPSGSRPPTAATPPLRRGRARHRQPAARAAAGGDDRRGRRPARRASSCTGRWTTACAMRGARPAGRRGGGARRRPARAGGGQGAERRRACTSRSSTRRGP